MTYESLGVNAKKVHNRKLYLQGAKIDLERLDNCTSKKELWTSYLCEANIKGPLEDSHLIHDDNTYCLRDGSGGP